MGTACKKIYFWKLKHAYKGASFQQLWAFCQNSNLCPSNLCCYAVASNDKGWNALTRVTKKKFTEKEDQRPKHRKLSLILLWSVSCVATCKFFETTKPHVLFSISTSPGNFATFDLRSLFEITLSFKLHAQQVMWQRLDQQVV